MSWPQDKDAAAVVGKCCDEKEDEDEEEREEAVEDKKEEEEDGRRMGRRLREICPRRKSPAAVAETARLDAEAPEESIAIDSKER